MTLVVCTGTGTEIGKTWVGAVLSALGRPGSPWRPASRRSPSIRPTPGRPTPTCSRPPRASIPTTCAPRTAGIRHRWRHRWPPPCSSAVFTVADLVDELRWPARTRRALARNDRGCALPDRLRRRQRRHHRGPRTRPRRAGRRWRSRHDQLGAVVGRRCAPWPLIVFSTTTTNRRAAHSNRAWLAETGLIASTSTTVSQVRSTSGTSP